MNKTRLTGSKPLQELSNEHSTLRTLQERLHASQARLKVVQNVLPASLGASLLPGGYDPDTHNWAIITPNATIASKLRHFIPEMKNTLNHSRLHVSELRIKVQTRT